MARARNIKPGFFTNEELVELPYEYRLLFIGLWTIADKEGRLECRPKKIKMEVFPADNVDIQDGLNQLEARGFLVSYDVNGSKYIEICNWHKHQSPHHTEKSSVIPPRHNGEITVSSQKQYGGNPPDSLIPDSLIPDSPIVEGEGISTSPASENEKPSRSKTAIPPDFEPDEANKREAGFLKVDLQTEVLKFTAHYQGTGEVKADWQAVFRKWILNAMQYNADAAKRSTGPPGETEKDRSRREAYEVLTGRRANEQAGDTYESVANRVD